MSTLIQPPKRSARVTTIVWGAVLFLVAGLLLVGQFLTLSVDPVVATLCVLVGAGLALVTGGALAMASRKDRDEDAAGDDGRPDTGYTDDAGDIDTTTGPWRY